MKSNDLDAAITNLNSLNAEYAAFLKPDVVSPATKVAHTEKVARDLRAAERLVDEIEMDLMSAVKPYAEYTQVPTFSGLERRIDYLKSKAGARYGNQIAEAKFAVNAAYNQIHTLVPSSKDLIAVNKEITKQYDIIENAIKELGEANLDEARLLGKSAEYKKRYYGKEVHYKFYKGNYYKIDSLTNDNQLGAAMREELNNTATIGNTYLNEMNVGTRQTILMRKSPNSITDVNNP